MNKRINNKMNDMNYTNDESTPLKGYTDVEGNPKGKSDRLLMLMGIVISVLGVAGLSNTTTSSTSIGSDKLKTEILDLDGESSPPDILLTVNNQFDAATADGSLPWLTSCADLQSYNGACSGLQCNDNYAEWNCDGSGPTCTPFHFKPRGYPNPDCPFMDSGDWDMSAFQYNGDTSQYQVWCVKSSTDDPCPGDKVWLTHLCDGAGVQASDCGGDQAYFEEIVIHPEAGVDQSCDGDDYGVTHTDCPTFNHPGKSTLYGKYKAGWWRGFKESQNALLSYPDNQILAAAMGDNADYSSNMNNLAQRDGWFYNHPWENTGADAYLIGNLYPWRCTKTDEVKDIPFTGSQYRECYADNEPATGRQQGKKDQNIPFFSTYALCAVYSSHTDDMQMRCNFNSYDRDGNLEKTENVLMFPAGEFDY